MWNKKLAQIKDQLEKTIHALRKKGINFGHYAAYERFRKPDSYMEDHSDDEGNPIFTHIDALEPQEKYRELIVFKNEVDKKKNQKELEFSRLDDFDNNKAEVGEILIQLNKLIDFLNEEMELRVTGSITRELVRENARVRQQIHCLINQHHHLRCLRCCTPLLWLESAKLRLWLIRVEDYDRRYREYIAYHLHCPGCQEPYHPEEGNIHYYSEPIVSPSCRLSYQQLDEIIRLWKFCTEDVSDVRLKEKTIYYFYCHHCAANSCN